MISYYNLANSNILIQQYLYIIFEILLHTLQHTAVRVLVPSTGTRVPTVPQVLKVDHTVVPTLKYES